MRVSELFNTLLFTQQQQDEQEVRVSELFNTLLFTQQLQEELELTVIMLNEEEKCFLQVSPQDIDPVKTFFLNAIQAKSSVSVRCHDMTSVTTLVIDSKELTEGLEKESAAT